MSQFERARPRSSALHRTGGLKAVLGPLLLEAYQTEPGQWCCAANAPQAESGAKAQLGNGEAGTQTPES